VDLMNFEFEERLEQAVDANMMFYDNESENISKKLIYLMWGHSGDRLETVLIPTDLYPEFDIWGETRYGKTTGAFLNIKYVRDRRLDFDNIKELIKHYDISMPVVYSGMAEKHQFVMGIYRDKTILGAV
jgi:hypothetical protein